MAKTDPNIHPELQQAARMAPKITFSKHNLWLLNGLMRLMPAPKIPPEIRVENVWIPGLDERAKIRLRIYQPKPAPAPAPGLLWFHGGGYVMGRPEQDDAACVQYAQELGITVISVDYRVAPRDPFPAGLNDADTVLQWAAAHAQKVGVDAKRIAVGGASAGGGLAAALAQLARDRQGIQPVFQLLVYPMLDDRTVLRADIEAGRHIAWNQASNRFGWESYLGKKCGAEDAPRYSAPARREDLSGLPPAWIGVGSVDLFHAEDTAYAQRLQEHGVPCDLHIVPGAFHGFDVFDPKLAVVQEFRKSQIAALKKNLFA